MTVCRNKKARGVAPRFRTSPKGERSLVDGGRAVLLLDDAGRLAAEAAQVIELGTTHLAATHHLDRVDHRGEQREYALHALAVGNLANGEALIDATAGAADADAFIGLHAGAVAFDDLHIHHHG